MRTFYTFDGKLSVRFNREMVVAKLGQPTAACILFDYNVDASRCIYVFLWVGETWVETYCCVHFMTCNCCFHFKMLSLTWPVADMNTFSLNISPGEHSPMHTLNQFVLFSALLPIKSLLLLCNCKCHAEGEHIKFHFTLFYDIISFLVWLVRARLILANVSTLYASQHGHNAICSGRRKCDGKIIMSTVRLREGRQ